MTYTLPAWADEPSTDTPTNAANLTMLNTAIGDLDTRTTAVETVKATITYVDSGDGALDTRLAAVESGKINASTLTAKGDLYVATASGTVVRIGIGSNDQVLTADSAQTPGMTWKSISQSMVGSLTTDLAAKAPSASPALTGSGTFATLAGTTLTVTGVTSLNTTQFNKAAVNVPVALTDAATIAVDASLGNHFRVTLSANRTLGAPSNGTDGQKMLIEVSQDGTGARTLAYNAIYGFGTDVTSPTLSTGAGKVDYLGFVYNSAANKWRCLAVAKGY